MKFEIIKGDLIQKALAGEFDVVAHGCNCFCTMGAGIALQFKEKLKANKASAEGWGKGDFTKLGNLSAIALCLEDGQYATKGDYDQILSSFEKLGVKSVTVINAYTQYKPGRNLDYEALVLCMRKINHLFKGKHIGLPWIGCGIAGGDKTRVEQILREELKDCDVTICEL